MARGSTLRLGWSKPITVSKAALAAVRSPRPSAVAPRVPKLPEVELNVPCTNSRIRAGRSVGSFLVSSASIRFQRLGSGDDIWTIPCRASFSR